MKWSWKIGSVAGIKVYVHSTFLILLGWIAVSHWTADHSYLAVAEGVGFILAIFSCVVAHELGHALAAQQYGITTRDITLLPIGGVARLERMPDKPWEEFVVALAGPLVNVVIAAALFIGLKLGGWLVAADSLSVTGGPFLVRLLAVNVFLVVFNLLPAFPMDGGRVLRAILAARMEYTKATQIAANIGQSMALMFLFLADAHQSILDLHRLVRLDRGRTRGQHGSGPVSNRWDSGATGDDYQLSYRPPNRQVAPCR